MYTATHLWGRLIFCPLSLIEACRFKDLPRKKISNLIDRSVSDFSVGYEDENENKKNINTIEPVDFLIVDDDED